MLKQYTKVLTLLFSFILLMSSNVQAKEMNISLIINSTPITKGAKPVEKNGRTLAPIRVIAENLNCDVSWAPETKKVTVTKGTHKLEMFIGNPRVKVDGVTKIIDVPPILHNGSTMIPLRFVGEALGCEVKWDAKSHTVYVNSRDADVEVEETKKGLDNWGRKIRTTNLPKNYELFSYVVESVPNWVYEKINMTSPILMSKENFGGYRSPRDFYNKPENISYDKLVVMLNEYFNHVINIDYRTINEKEFTDFMIENVAEDTVPAIVRGDYKDMTAACKDYIKFIKSNKIIISGEWEVLPEMFWTNKMGSIVICTQVKYKVEQQGKRGGGGFTDFGDSCAVGKFPYSETDREYEGLLQFTLKGTKVNYTTSSYVCQIVNNDLGGRK